VHAVGDNNFKCLRRWQHCPVIMKMYEIDIYIYIHKHKILHEKHIKVYWKYSHGIQFSLNYNPGNFKFPTQ
jgi:hypothetical protein